MTKAARKSGPTPIRTGWRFAAAVILILALVSCDREIVAGGEYRPVVFVHGHGLGPRDWDRMIRELTRRGYARDALLAVEIIPNVMRNDAAAETVIAKAVEDLLGRTNNQANVVSTSSSQTKVDIIAHSMGAVSARYYAAKIAPEHVATVITLGGANHGSDYMCNFADPGAADLCPAFADEPSDSEIQIRLNGSSTNPLDETPWGVGEDPRGRERISPDSIRAIAFYSIYIENDAWIVPPESALLAGAGGNYDSSRLPPVFVETMPGNFLLTTDTIHDDLPWDSDVVNLVADLLAGFASQ